MANYGPMKRPRTNFGSPGPKDLSPFPVEPHNLNHVSVFLLLFVCLACLRSKLSLCSRTLAPPLIDVVLAYQNCTHYLNFILIITVVPTKAAFLK